MNRTVTFFGLRASQLAPLGAAGVWSLLLALTSNNARAQASAASSSPETASPTDAETLSEIVVTGSRLVRSGFDAPTPVTVLGAETLQARGAVNLADATNELPAFRASATPHASTQVGFTAGMNFADLRGLGPSRTLVLVDGVRFVPATNTGLVDLNMIPSILVDRVEVVTGGASAAYGSDAVAGVVNIVTKDRATGLKGELQYGVSELGDDQRLKAALLGGLEFADGRGSLIYAAEYNDNEGVRFQSSRDWADDQYHLITNPSFTPSNGQPQRLIARDAHLSYATYNGLINSGPLRGTEFLPNGQTRQFTFGSSVGSSYMIGGDGINPDDEKALSFPLERFVAYAKPSFKLTDSLVLSADFSYGETSGGGAAFSLPSPALTIRQDNAFLPQSVRDQMIALNLPSFTMGRIHHDFALAPLVDIETLRGVTRLEGDMGSAWSWALSYEYGETRYQSQFVNNTISANLSRALDAVNVGGSIVCRSTLTDPSNGCTPINLFGDGSARLNPAALDYITNTQMLVTRLREHSVLGTVNARPFSLWAGPLALVLGAEYRYERSAQVSDPIAQARGFAISNAQTFSGNVHTSELFGELAIPLAAHAPVAKYLELNLAGRMTDYSTSGSVSTWKAGLSYEPFDSLRFRATYSRDIRAPNVLELFSPDLTAFFTATDPFNANRQDFVMQLISGNTALDPEESDTFTVGAILSPAWAPNLTLSADYFDIQIDEAIGVIPSQQIIDRCFNGSSQLCALIDRDSTGRITTVHNRQLNISQLKVRGVDLEARYQLPLDRLFGGAPGMLQFALLANYLDTLTSDDGITRIESAGVVGTEIASSPHWRANGSVTYSTDSVTAFLQGRFVGGGDYSSTFGVNGINDNSIDGQFIVNTSLQFKLGAGETALFLLVNNVFDEDPPIDPGVFIYGSQTNPVLYEMFGRSYAMGVRFAF